MQNDENALISVIVPIYNAEMWLRQCIESILAQTYRNLDIILVDDGSVDRSCSICEEYAAKDSRIRIISKANTGVSDSRNVGIEAAQGAYITFVDADDYLPDNILNEVIAVMKREPDALCAWNLACVFSEAIVQEPPIHSGIIDRKTAINATIYNRCANVPLGRYFRACWAKLYRTDIMKENRIRFCVQQHIGEDAMFLLEYLKYVERIRVINTTGYFYRITEGSAARRYREDLLQQNQQQLDAMCAYFENEHTELTVEMQTALMCLAWDMFQRLIRNQIAGNSKNTRCKHWKKDAQTWFLQNKGIMQERRISLKYVPKTIKLHYTLSARLPIDAVCEISAILQRK